MSLNFGPFEFPTNHELLQTPLAGFKWLPEFCSECKSLDFSEEKLFEHLKEGLSGVVERTLGVRQASSLRESNCKFCKLLWSMRVGDDARYEITAIYPTTAEIACWDRLGMPTPDHVVLFSVVPKSQRFGEYPRELYFQKNLFFKFLRTSLRSLDRGVVCNEVGPRVNFKRVLGWLEDCKLYHDHEEVTSFSSVGEYKKLRLRLIDCSKTPYRIVRANPNSRYLSPSYVWGHSERNTEVEVDELISYPADALSRPSLGMR